MTARRDEMTGLQCKAHPTFDAVFGGIIQNGSGRGRAHHAAQSLVSSVKHFPRTPEYRRSLRLETAEVGFLPTSNLVVPPDAHHVSHLGCVSLPRAAGCFSTASKMVAVNLGKAHEGSCGDCRLCWSEIAPILALALAAVTVSRTGAITERCCSSRRFLLGTRCSFGWSPNEMRMERGNVQHSTTGLEECVASAWAAPRLFWEASGGLTTDVGAPHRIGFAHPCRWIHTAPVRDAGGVWVREAWPPWPGALLPPSFLSLRHTLVETLPSSKHKPAQCAN